MSIGAALLLALAPVLALAQGTLSGQGFGFPPGHLSARALATGGAFAELDPQTPINPATLANWGPAALYVEYAPEFRRVFVGDAEGGSRVVRFPLVMVGIPAGSRLTLGLSVATFLDRTSATSVRTEEIVAGETVTSIETFRSEGAINDLRLGIGWRVADRLRFGVGLHALTGENRIFVGRVFDDSSFASFGETSQIGYGGTAASAGVLWSPVENLALALSARLGRDLTTYIDDEERTAAGVPDRIGASVGYSGISGAAIAVRYEWQGWSSMQELGTGAATAYDTREFGLGAELEGPRIFGVTLPLRAGGRWRTLPFSSTGSQVGERGFAAGFGIPLRGNRSNIDIGLQRVTRSDDGDRRERSWILSMAVTVRP
ncbi:MAG: hypothetical protein ACRENI_11895 [Gemmatimonadaceae bacterium]